MTKIDYIAIGAMLKDMRQEPLNAPTIDMVADRLCDLFAADNPRFKREHFLSYVAGECGPNGGKVQSC